MDPNVFQGTEFQNAMNQVDRIVKLSNIPSMMVAENVNKLKVEMLKLRQRIEGLQRSSHEMFVELNKGIYQHDMLQLAIELTNNTLTTRIEKLEARVIEQKQDNLLSQRIEQIPSTP